MRGVRWAVKNLFELKSGRRVWVEGNVFEHSWRDGQVGFAILLTPLDQDGRSAWSGVVEDVMLTNNIVRGAASGIQLKHYRTPVRRVTVRNNLFTGLTAGGGAVRSVRRDSFWKWRGRRMCAWSTTRCCTPAMSSRPRFTFPTFHLY
jgi:hypothetical protein